MNLKEFSTMGSCCSRMIFNEEFTPGYKKFAHINFSVEGGSLISLMSKPVDFDRDLLTAERPFDNTCVENDFSKKYLDFLKTANLDYILMDTYFDTTDLLLLANGSYVSDTARLRRTELYNTLDIDKQIDVFGNLDEFISLWKNACDSFFDFIKKNCSDTKVILNCSRMAYKYEDSNGEVVTKESFMKLALKRNHIRDLLETYLLENYDVEVLSFDKNTILDKNHVFGLDPSHYTSDYYSTKLNQLIEIMGRYENYPYNHEINRRIRKSKRDNEMLRFKNWDLNRREDNFMISVIVPICGHNNSPQDIFNSINHQTIGFGNLEVIFVVDSSVNKFNRILKDYSDSYSNVKVIFSNKKCDYPGELKNIGIRNSTADYIIFFENVDELQKDAFEILYNKIECNYDVIYGNFFLGDDNKKNKWDNIDLNDGEVVIRDIINNGYVFTLPSAISSKIFKKSIISQNNLEFPVDVAFENSVFLSDYLLKSRSILVIDEYILKYAGEDDLWGTPIEFDSKDYLLDVMEAYIDIYYMFRVDDRLSDIFVHYLDYWFELFVKFNLTLFERFEILKFSEFLLGNFKDFELDQDFNLIIDLVCEKNYYEASIFSNLVNNRLIFKNSNNLEDYQKIIDEIDIFKKVMENNSVNDYRCDDEVYEFYNELANYNIELRIFDRFIDFYDDKRMFRAIKLINDYNFFDREFYICNQGYDFDLEPLLHYIFWGYKEGRCPNDEFDGIFYRNYYDNVSKSRLNPLVYFVLYGIKKGEIKINEEIRPESRDFIDKTLFEGKIRNFNDWGITKVKRDKKLIVSLTSFPERMDDLHFALYSLLNQDLKPDNVILWLARNQFPNGEKDIPEKVLNLKRNGLSIEWCDNLFSYKKLIPALKKYPDHIIVTADDDLFYPSDWLRKLYEEHKKYPNLIIAHRIRKIYFDKNNLMSRYNDWVLSFHEEFPSFLNFSTNGAGTLFPPNSLNELVVEEDLFKKICPTSDDVWIWAMAVLNNTKIKGVKNSFTKLNYVNLARDLNILNQKILFSINQMEGNDKQIANVLREFPEIMDNIINDN